MFSTNVRAGLVGGRWRLVAERWRTEPLTWAVAVE
jgi:hypothetical protein